MCTLLLAHIPAHLAEGMNFRQCLQAGQRAAPQQNGGNGDMMEEDVGPLVGFQEFQQGAAGLAQYLLRRASAEGIASRSMRLSLR